MQDLGPASAVVATAQGFNSAGGVHTLALKADGSVIAWGSDSSGQLGNGSEPGGTSPVRVHGLDPGSGVVAVAAGHKHSLALKGDGTVLAWGSNEVGQLGDGASHEERLMKSDVPVVVAGLGRGSGVTAIAAGGQHSLALKADGSVFAWGFDRYGQLGDGDSTGSTEFSSRPVGVSGLGRESGVVAIAAGGLHSLAVKAKGSVLAWGANDHGQLGNGSVNAARTPVEVSGLEGGPVVTVDTGEDHTIAVKADGSVLAWGANQSGKLGDGSTAPATRPVAVKDLGPRSGVASVAAGAGHSLALKGDGAVLAWGGNPDGRLGNGSKTSSLTPVQVSGLGAGSGVFAIEAALESIALTRAAGSITAVGGTPQNAVKGTAFTAPLEVVVKDGTNRPVGPGVTVTFGSPASGPSAMLDKEGNTSTTVTTDASGVARAEVTANMNEGPPYTVVATTSGVAAPARFVLTNVRSAAEQLPPQVKDPREAQERPLVISAIAGTPQRVPLGQEAEAMKAIVKHGADPVAGFPVSFTAPTGPAPGPTTATTPPPPTMPTTSSPDMQTAIPNDTRPSNTNASGSFEDGTAQATVLTGDDGVATAPRFVANNLLGPYSVQVSRGEVRSKEGDTRLIVAAPNDLVPRRDKYATPGSFDLTNVPTPETITACGGTRQVAAVATSFARPLRAFVSDHAGRPAPDVDVTFTAPDAGPGGSFPGGEVTVTVPTDSGGVATTPVFMANATLGTYTVVARVDGLNGMAQFELENTRSGAVPPVVEAVSPQLLGQGASDQPITVRGVGFGPGATVSFSGAGIVVVSTSSGNDSSLVANVTVSPTAAAGPRDVVVTNADGQSGVCRGCFNIAGVTTGLPTVGSAVPDKLPQGTATRQVAVIGTNFTEPMSLALSGEGITVHATSVQSATKLAATVSVDDDAATGPRQITVTDAHGRRASCSACISVVAPFPHVGSTDPSSLPAATSETTVAILGAGFVSGATIAFSGEGITVKEATFASPSRLDAAVSIAEDAPTGPRDIRVANPEGAILTCEGCFTVTIPVEDRRSTSGAWRPTGSFAGTSADSCDGAATASCAPRHQHSATLLDGSLCVSPAAPEHCGKVLMAGGALAFTDDTAVDTGDTLLASAQVYDPAKATWEATQPLGLPRAEHTATLLDGPRCLSRSRLPTDLDYCGKVLVVGGRVRFGMATSSVELYDPEKGSWSDVRPLLTARFSHTATLLNGPECRENVVSAPLWCGKVLVAGGTATAVGRTPVGSAELYDPATGTWAPTGALNTARATHTATGLAAGACGDACGDVLVTGGAALSPTTPSAAPHVEPPQDATTDPIYRNWAGRQVGHTASVFALDSIAPLRSSELYDPALGVWRPAAPMDVGRFAQSATLLTGSGCAARCGGVLVAGGASGSGPGGLVLQPSAEVFSPVGTSTIKEPDGRTVTVPGRWTAAGLPNAGRASHTATQLADGKVLVAGSSVPFDVPGPAPRTSAEVYDPRTDRWSHTGSLSDARGLHAATLLTGPACRGSLPPTHCGTVLVSGGGSDHGRRFATGYSLPPLAGSELYTEAPAVTAVSPVRGPASGGTKVQIAGAGFDTDSVVRFGDGAAVECGTGSPSCQVESGRKLVVRTPPGHKGPQPVVVSNSAGPSSLNPASVRAMFTYVGSAGEVDDLVATAVSDSVIELAFTAPDDGTTTGLASSFVVKQSPAEITRDNFEAAETLCAHTGGICTFDEAGQRAALRVDNLVPATTYHFALRPLNALGDPGSVSNDAFADTDVSAARQATTCPALNAPAAGQLAYPGGAYSLVSLPEGTVVSSDSPLYGWIDKGSGGQYEVHPGNDAVTAGRGYWAWFACPRLVELSGPGVPSARLPLGAYHASMVGNPSGEAPASVTGHDFAAVWEPSLNGGRGGYQISGYREAVSLAVGQGAWTFTYEDTTISVDAVPKTLRASSE